MSWLKPTTWLAVLCRQVAAQRFGMAVVWAVLGCLVLHGAWRWLQWWLLGQPTHTLGFWLGTTGAYALLAWQGLWPILMLSMGAWGVVQRWSGERVYRRMHKQSRHGFEELSWQDFEALTAELFRRHGFEVIPHGGDHADGGIDVVVKRDDAVYLVQCKHWLSQRVGVKVVRELYGVVAAEGMDGGYVVTSGFFTPDAVEFANGIAMQLINGQQLLDVLEDRLGL